MVAYVLKYRKTSRKPRISCAISIDGFNTLISNFNHLAHLSGPGPMFPVFCCHCRPCTVNDPVKITTRIKLNNLSVRIVMRSLRVLVVFTASNVRIDLIFEVGSGSRFYVDSKRQDKTNKDGGNHYLELVFN